mmetsp:Transcript_16470/g.23319  ORF Transcript_16470/g.23319 Transcript_16470/m.23319 type:complete len:173 (-) Transcript_16470:168-686(-)
MRKTSSQKNKALSSGDEQKERLQREGEKPAFSAAANRLFDYPAILCSSTFSDEDTRSYDPSVAAPPLHVQHHLKQYRQHQMKSISDGLAKRSNPPDPIAGCSILDHIEMGNYAHDHVASSSTDEKRDDDNICESNVGICDEKDIIYEYEEEQNMVGCCEHGNVFKFLQFHEM